MRFFTDKTVNHNYLLVKLIDYLKMDDFSPWDEILIDPGVYDLTKSDNFSWVCREFNVRSFLNSLPENHYFSWDYPCDMNLKYQDVFLSRTWNRALCYHKHPHYIITVQSKFRDYQNFIEWFDRYNRLEIASGIMGLGNMCRFRALNEFLKHSLDYAFSHCAHPRIHIYGLCFKAIPYTNKLSKQYNIEVSIDNTKWTRACTVELKEKYGINSSGLNRQEFFDTYMKRLEESL